MKTDSMEMKENLLTKDSNLDKKQEINEVQKEILDRLHQAANSQTRVETFAKLMDTYGLDPIISLIPALGDAGTTGIAGLYLLIEAQRAGINKSAYLKIIGLQAADFFAGAIPIVGDVADYFFKANKWSANDFKNKTKELVTEAQKAGVAQEDIVKITDSAEKLPQLVSKAIAIQQKIKSS